MTKKTYIMPSMKVLKIEASRLLDLSQGDDDMNPDSKAFNSGSDIWQHLNSDEKEPEADRE